MRRTVALAFLLLAPLFAETRELDLTPGGGWVDTGIELKPGDTFRVTASGSVKYFDAKQENGPEGLNRGWADLIRALPVNEAGRGAVVGRIGTSAAARAFLIGAQHEGTAPVAGRLYVGVNEPEDSRGTGSFHLKIERTAAASSPKTGYHLPEFTQELLDAIPRRVTDAAGGAGDRVNFIVIGPQEKMQAAFKAAGWVIADRTERDAVLAGLIATLSKEAYVTMPMSTLYLFGRPQDFGYAQADPIRVIASRHHFRIWKAPGDLDGQTVWAGAGTHDIGFDRDQRNGKLTHKIDADVDGERDYIRDSLSQTGMVAKTEYMTPKDPVLTARTATGDEFKSDGRTLIVYLIPDSN